MKKDPRQLTSAIRAATIGGVSPESTAEMESKHPPPPQDDTIPRLPPREPVQLRTLPNVWYIKPRSESMVGCCTPDEPYVPGERTSHLSLAHGRICGGNLPFPHCKSATDVGLENKTQLAFSSPALSEFSWSETQQFPAIAIHVRGEEESATHGLNGLPLGNRRHQRQLVERRTSVHWGFIRSSRSTIWSGARLPSWCGRMRRRPTCPSS